MVLFNVHPEIWGRCPIWQAYFSDGLVQPPRSSTVHLSKWRTNPLKYQTVGRKVRQNTLIIPHIPHESVMYEDTSIKSYPLTAGKYDEGDVWCRWFESYVLSTMHIRHHLEVCHITFMYFYTRYIRISFGLYLILIYQTMSDLLLDDTYLYIYSLLQNQSCISQKHPVKPQENLGWSWYWRVLPWCATDFSLSQ